MTQLDWNNIWAKSPPKDNNIGLSLIDHTKHVFESAVRLLEVLPIDDKSKDYWKPKLLKCAILHDIGKVHPIFQKKLRKDKSIKDLPIRHEIISAWLCENYLDLSIDEVFAISTHHKGIIYKDDKNRLSLDVLCDDTEYYISNYSETFNHSYEILKYFLSQFGLDNILINPKNQRSTISEELIQCLNFMDQKNLNFDTKLQLSKMRALLIAVDHIGSAKKHYEIPTYRQIELTDFQPRNKETEEYCPFRSFQKRLQTINHDVLLYAPTGSGKTEAALGWVYANQIKNTRLFYLLPYTASINAMVVRLQNIFGIERVTALHSKTLDFFYDQLTAESSNEGKANEFYEDLQQEAQTKRSLSKELYYPVKVATPYQILKCALRGKGWEMSLFDFQNALFVIDEFHTYDALTTGLMLATAKWLKREFNAKIFFMSATIPQFMKDLILQHLYKNKEEVYIEPNPLEQSDLEILDRKRHLLQCIEDKQIIDDITFIKELIKQGKTILVIVNNVKTAQKIFDEINDESISLSLLHSGFHKKDRIEIEKQITNKSINKRPKLLIATQAVEVSLDIDYDIGFTENAPIDALIQRFGRINRAGKKGQAPIYLFKNIIGKTPFYNTQILEDTWLNLKQLDKQALSEADLVEVCNKVYEKGYNEEQQEDFEKGLNYSNINNFRDYFVAGHCEDWVEDLFEKDKNQKLEVLCGNLIPDFKQLKEQGKYIEANQLLVSAYRYELEKNIPKDKKLNIYVSYNLHYHSEKKIGYTTGETII